MATISGRWGQSVKLKITFETQKSHFKCDFGSRVSHLKRIFPLSNVILDFQRGEFSSQKVNDVKNIFCLTFLQSHATKISKSLIAISDYI